MGAVGASGATFGLIVGGVIADTIGWEWIFLLNVPIGLLTVAIVFVFVPESHASTDVKSFDAAGAVSVTAGLALLVYTIVDANSAGWGSMRTIGLFVLSGLLLAVFVVSELRSTHPLVPFRIFRLGAVAGSNAASFMLGAAMFGAFFIITLYLQQVSASHRSRRASHGSQHRSRLSCRRSARRRSSPGWESSGH